MKATRDQARVDAERARAAIETAGQSLSPAQLTRFAAVARRRMRGKDGGFQRDHLRAFAKRVEVSEREVRIMGSKNTLLRVLAASNGVESAANDVRIYGPEWRRGWDSNPRDGCPPAGFQDRCLQPLGHLSSRSEIHLVRTGCWLQRFLRLRGEKRCPLFPKTRWSTT